MSPAVGLALLVTLDAEKEREFEVGILGDP
jgi:hypothetical protein